VGLGMVVKEGGVVRGGCEVVGLEKKGKRVQGVVLKSGDVVRGDIVLVRLFWNLSIADPMVDRCWSLVCPRRLECVLITGHLPFVHQQA
jgi:glycine/D-amino acid oxidase-like deaminating enzyme